LYIKPALLFRETVLLSPSLSLKESAVLLFMKKEKESKAEDVQGLEIVL
jgi:hypothetical protein